MKNLSLIGLLFCLLICSCQHKTDGLLTLKLDNAGQIDPDKELSLDALGMKVKAIPLETTDSCLIKEVSGLEESRDYYWIVSDMRVYQFDKKGHFVQYIGVTGQGPEEYLSAKAIKPVEEEQVLYVMDYFGRKMCVYGFDGRFLRSFKLPEETWIDNFRYADGKIYYLTTGNSVMPDLYCYDIQTEHMDTLCKRDREMGTEGYMGQTYTYTLDDDMYMFHYFNDTIYRVGENGIVPAWIFHTGKLKWGYDELTLTADFTPLVKPDGPRIQVFDLFETKDYVFVFYTISRFGEEMMKPLMALYDKKQTVFYPHVNLISPDAPWLSVEKGKRLMQTSVSGSLYAIKEAADLAGKKGDKTIKEDDNPVLLRYTCE